RKGHRRRYARRRYLLTKSLRPRLRPNDKSSSGERMQTQPEDRLVKPEVVIDAPQALAHLFADLFSAQARAAIAAGRQFSCALPGGSVAETFFRCSHGRRWLGIKSSSSGAT